MKFSRKIGVIKMTEEDPRMQNSGLQKKLKFLKNYLHGIVSEWTSLEKFFPVFKKQIIQWHCNSLTAESKETFFVFYFTELLPYHDNRKHY